MERGIVPFAWDTNSLGENSMTIINRANLTIYNSYMMDGIRDAISELQSTAVESHVLHDDATSPAIYRLDGKKVDGRNLQPGIYISNGKKFVVGR